MKTDQEIWEEFKSGDKDALSLVYFQNFESLYQYGMKFRSDQEFVKDCIQEVFYKLIKSGANLGTTNNIQFYLFRALKHVILKEFEKEGKVESATSESIDFHSTFTWEEQVAENEKSNSKEKALAQALSSLSARQKEIIYLRYQKGLGYEEICQIMNLKNDSARKLVLRAVKALKATLQSQIKKPILFLIQFGKKYVL